MTAIKIPEDYSIRSLRNDVRDALVMSGEEAILLQLYHPEVDKIALRCGNCSDDVYSGGAGDCTVCYGTSIQGGVKYARRVLALFSDHVAAESYTKQGKQGMWAPDQREIQTEGFPMLLEHDVVVRVRRWDDQHRPAELEGYYMIMDVTRSSLRTGNRFGQYGWDVVAQRARINKLPDNLAIAQYPVLDQDFSDVIDPGATIYNPPVTQPDVRVVFVEGEDMSQRPFTHTQSSPARVWTIPHPLDHLPSVTVIVNNELVDAGVNYIDNHTVEITFADPTAGFAVLI